MGYSEKSYINILDGKEAIKLITEVGIKKNL